MAYVHDPLQYEKERAAAKARGAPYAEEIELEWPSCTGAPLPILLDTGDRTFLVYYTMANEPTRILVTFDRAVDVRMGPPNDEALNGHPLWGSGLRFYCAHVVQRSPWIAELERRNRVHPSHSADHYSKYKHFIFCFHDETVEVVAHGFRCEKLRPEPDGSYKLGDYSLRRQSPAPFP
jgi:hypothetical protein